MRARYIFFIIALLIILLILTVLCIRLFSAKELDDVTPGIQCDHSLLEKSDVLYVIPKFKNVSINKSWCQDILKLGKKIGMHGVYHSYEEFKQDRNASYVDEGIQIFKDCFGFFPERFKPPQLAINTDNAKLIRNMSMKLEAGLVEANHKVYHCNDTGRIKNWIVDLI